MNHVAAFSSAFSRFFGGGEVFLLSKGRVGLYLALKALGLGPGDKVLLPGYTCVVVPSAALFLGVHPTYVDIDPISYNISPEALQKADAGGVKALVVQHTYGIPADMANILSWAADKGIPVIEDCCHAMGSSFKGQLLGTFGVASFFSGQWNKPFSTGLGGMLLVNRPDLASEVRELYRRAEAPGPIRDLRLKAQIVAYNAVASPRRMGRVTQLYRFLGAAGLALGSSTEGELRGRMPQDYFSRMAPSQAREGLRKMELIHSNIAHRKGVATHYARSLPALGFQALPENAGEDPVILRYPLRVGNKAALIRKAVGAGVELGSWFETPLHPEAANMEAFGYRRGLCSTGDRASLEVVNLPTHPGVSRRDLDATLTFLDREAQRL